MNREPCKQKFHPMIKLGKNYSLQILQWLLCSSQ